MELFKITCVTCKARLSVRNRDLIGQIIACPRCDSMVQVLAPQTAILEKSPEQDESVAQQAVAPTCTAESVSEMETNEPDPLFEDAASLGEFVALAKYKLIAWTLACFSVGAALGGIYFYSSESSPENNAGSADTVAKEEKVAAVPPDEASAGLSPQSESETKESSELPVSQEDALITAMETEAANTVEIKQPSAPPETTTLAVETEPQKKQAKVSSQTSTTRRIDPLSLDPESLDLAGLAQAEQPSKNSESSAAEKPNAPSPENALPQSTAESSVRRDPQRERRNPPPLAAEQMAQQLPELRIKDMPIVHYLSLISQLGGVPVSIAPEQLQMAGVTARHSVSLDARDVSLAEALSRVLNPLHLEHATDGHQVVVLRQEATKVREIEYPLDDLLNSSTSAGDIAAWVKKFVLPEVDSSAMEVDGTTLTIKQPQELQFRALIFLERIRLARNLQPRSRFPVQRLAATPAYVSLVDRLEAPTTFTFSQYTPLTEIIRYWQREIGVPILVDWPALAEFDLWPDSRIACAAENQTLSQALDTVLEPLGLGWRAATGESIQITSAKKVHTEVQLELYPLSVGLGNQAKQIVQQVTDLVDKQTSEISGRIPHAIDCDPNGNVLIVLGSSTVHRILCDWLARENLMQGK